MACVALSDLLDAYRARLRAVLGAGGHPVTVQVSDQVQPLEDLAVPMAGQDALLGVWCSSTVRDELQPDEPGEDWVRDTIEVQTRVPLEIEQEAAYSIALQVEDAVVAALTEEWDGKPCVDIEFASVLRERSKADILATITFSTLRLQAGA